MLWGPDNVEEAKVYRYGTWGGNPKGWPWNPDKCAQEVGVGGRSPLFAQCDRKPGWGPDCLYCKQHSKGRMPVETPEVVVAKPTFHEVKVPLVYVSRDDLEPIVRLVQVWLDSRMIKSERIGVHLYSLKTALGDA